MYENDASSSAAISPDFLYDHPDLVVLNTVGLVARLSTRIPQLPPNVTNRSGEHSQTFNSPDFDGMKCTQLSPLKYVQTLKNDIIHQLSANKIDASSSVAISPDFIYDLPDLVLSNSRSYTL